MTSMKMSTIADTTMTTPDPDPDEPTEEDLDFIMSIGYYSKIMQTIKFVPGFDSNQYTMVD